MKRKNLITLLVLALCAALALAACSKDEPAAEGSLEQQIAALTQENAALKEQVEVLTRQLESIQNAVLVSWDLNATASADSTIMARKRFLLFLISRIISFFAADATASASFP